jgi:hypothetical protein
MAKPHFIHVLHRSLLATAIACSSYANEPASLLAKPSPKLVMSTLDGKSTTQLSGHVGKVVAIQIWASWISTNYAPVARMQDIAVHNESWAGKVELFTLSVDRDREQASKIVSKHRWNRTKNLAVDIDKLKEFGISTLPATIIIAADRTIASLDVLHAIDIEKEVKALLNDPSE